MDKKPANKTDLKKNKTPGKKSGKRTSAGRHLEDNFAVDFKDLCESVSDIIYVIDIKGYFVYANPPALKSSGYTLRQLTKHNYLELVLPEYRTQIRNFYLKQIENRKKISYYEYPFKTNSGQIKWFGQNANLIIKKRKLLGFYVVARDITARKNAEKKIVDENSFNRKLFEENIYPMWVHNTKTLKFLAVNAAAISTYGYGADEFLSMQVDDLLDRSNGTSASITSGIYKHIRKNGAVIDVDVTSHPYTYRDKPAMLVMVKDITEKKKREAEIDNLQKQQKAILDSIPDIAWLKDTGSRFIAVNRAYLKVSGLNYNRIIGKKDSDIWPKEVAAKYIENDKSVFNSGKAQAVQEPVYVGEGKINWFETIRTPVFDSEHNIIGVTGISRNITRKRKIIRTLKESERRFRQILKNVNMISIILDLEGNLTFCNDFFLKIAGYSREELHNKNWIEHIIPSEIKEQIKKVFDNAVKNGEEFAHYENEIVTKSGDRHLIMWNNIIMYDNRNCISGITSFGTDITDSRRAEHELKQYREDLEKLVVERTNLLDTANKNLEEEIEKLTRADEKIQNQLEFLRTLIDTIPSPIFVKNKNCIFDDCNKAFEEFTLLGKNKIIGYSIFDFAPLNIAKKVNSLEAELLAVPGRKSMEFNLSYPKIGTKTVILEEATYLRADSSVGGIVGVIIDITEQKELNKKMQEALNKEKQLNELKSRFITTTSHEFKTPLTKILSSADFLDLYLKSQKDNKVSEHLKRIQASVDYMTELLDDVLTINRSQLGRMEFLPERLNLNILCREIIRDLKIDPAEKNRIIYVYNLENELALVDKKLIRFILINLLSNALKYSPSSEVVLFNIYLKEGNIIFEVKDRGIGIPQEDIENLFQPFHRGINAKQISGTGLGLSIVKKSVEVHNGKISFESTINQGTTFTVALPCK